MGQAPSVMSYTHRLIFLSNSGYGSAREDLGEMIFSAFFEGEKDAKNVKIEMDKGYI